MGGEGKLDELLPLTNWGRRKSRVMGGDRNHFRRERPSFKGITGSFSQQRGNTIHIERLCPQKVFRRSEKRKRIQTGTKSTVKTCLFPEKASYVASWGGKEDELSKTFTEGSPFAAPNRNEGVVGGRA